MSDMDDEVRAANSQGDMSGAVSVKEAQAALTILLDEAVRIDVGTDVLEALRVLGKYLSETS